MSLGMMILVVLALLILFGVLQRVLDRMALTDKQALICVAAIFIGGLIPDLRFGAVSLNVGGALIPFLVCLYLLIRAGTSKEKARCLVASALSAACVYAISTYFPADPAAMPFDPLPLYGLGAGLIAWFLGRSRRGAFVAGVLGVILADVITSVHIWRSGVDQTLYLGGAGALDAVVLSGVIAVLVCELIGEICERFSRRQNAQPHQQVSSQGGQHA